MPKAKIIFNRKVCIGAAICVNISPKFWKLAEDGKADLLGSVQNPGQDNYTLEREISENELASLKESASSCPALAITVKLEQ